MQELCEFNRDFSAVCALITKYSLKFLAKLENHTLICDFLFKVSGGFGKGVRQLSP